jgi:hypothetical protein
MVRAKINLKSLNLLVLLAIIAIYILIYFSFFSNNNNKGLEVTQTMLRGYTLSSFLIFIFCLYYRFVTQRKVIDIYMFFLFVFWLFMFGQSFNYLIGYKGSGNNNIFTNMGFSNYEILRSEVYCVLCMLFLHLGINLKSKDSVNSVKDVITKYNFNNKVLRITGSILLILSIIPHINYIKYLYIYGVVQGYSSLYNNSTGSFSFFGNFFYIAILMLATTVKNKNNKKIILIPLIFEILIELLAGLRGAAIPLFLGIVIYYNLEIEKIKLKGTLLLIFIFVLLMFLIPVISDVRNLSNKSFSTLLESRGNSSILDAVKEMGGSRITVIYCMQIFPNYEPYMIGTSYFGSVIDTLFSSKILNSSMFGWTVWLGSWLQQFFGLNYGLGFSMAAESFVNFGNFGFLTFFIFGIIFNMLFRDIDKYKVNKNKICMLVIVFIYLCPYVRGQLIDTLKSITYYGIVPYILNLIIAKVVKRKV